MDRTVDTADAVHGLLDRLPEHKRTTALMLLSLPSDYAVIALGGPCIDDCPDPEFCDEDHPTVGWLTAGAMLRDLVHGITDPPLVLKVLNYRGLIRPGLAGTS